METTNDNFCDLPYLFSSYNGRAKSSIVHKRAYKMSQQETRESWTCSQCTYQHNDHSERHFLFCAMCSTPRESPTVVSSSLVSQQRRRRRRPFHDTTTTETVLERKTKTPKMVHRQTKLSWVNNNYDQGRNHLVTAAATPKNRRQKKDTTPSQSQSQSHKSILDVLQPRPSSFFVPQARYRESSTDDWKTISVHHHHNVADLARLGPMTVVRNVLPWKLANVLLEQLEQDATSSSSSSWNRGNWIVHGKQHVIPRTTATYQFETDMEDSNHQDTRALDDDEEYHDCVQRLVSKELRDAKNIIQQVVQQQCPWSTAWKPTFAFANRYKDGNDCVGFHSDHIATLGPRPIIAGLTLGACRRFDMKQQIASSSSSSTNRGRGNKSVPKTIKCRHISVPLPHNSLIIMWSDAQESWQHSVPRCSNDTILQHDKVGTVRISLTFRMERPVPPLGSCHCGRPVGLKAKQGTYYTFCIPYGADKSKTCGFWKPCPWAEAEAKRLAEMETCPKKV